jgi:hypothetical protein
LVTPSTKAGAWGPSDRLHFDDAFNRGDIYP